MPTIASSQVPPPRSWDEFEDIALAFAKLRWQSDDFYRNGRQGQKQDGVDIWGHARDGDHIGIQCKNTVDGVTLTTIQAEVSNAEDFVPKLERLYIATTARRDASLQREVRSLRMKGLVSEILELVYCSGKIFARTWQRMTEFSLLVIRNSWIGQLSFAKSGAT